MTNFILEQNVTSLEDSKRLAEAGIDLGADGYWIDYGDLKQIPIEFSVRQDVFIDYKWHTKAYRLDRLLAAIPDRIPSTNLVNEKFELILTFIRKGLLIKAIKACADLLILLKGKRE